MNKLEERRKRGQDPETKECPDCLSDVPAKASRCAFCTEPSYAPSSSRIRSSRAPASNGLSMNATRPDVGPRSLGGASSL